MNCNSSALGPGTYVWSNNTCYRLTGGSCTDNTSGRAGTCQTQEGTGDCSVPCSANFGLACNVNACGTAGGTYDCNDVCSGLTPAIPYTVGADCNRNACGGTGVIEDQCAGTCSASAPACVPTSTPVPVSVSTPTPTTAPGVAAPTPVPVICSPDAIRYVCTATSC
ncbi:MAG: hypothetical protein Q8O68_00015 [Candidatus Daviesbacteria bacterium]|nr:hypothetical protein [Candidatus Daviesbacteria bacterium]